MPRTLLTAAVLAALALFAADARADDPPFLPWTSALPALAGTYSPTSEDDCVAGRLPCVDKVIREMQNRVDALGCDHDAVFEYAYLLTTRKYREVTVQPGYFTDPRFVNHQDVVFAGYYFKAYDDWHAGRRGAVPPAWAKAFEAAQSRSVSGAGDLLLGMNAHINRDLPFALAAIGLVRPDGSSRKDDHDRVDRFLNEVRGAILAGIARRYDPTVDDPNLPTYVDELLSFQTVQAWREHAWRNAERLAVAATDADRAAVARSIEAQAGLEADSIRSATAYLAPLQGSAARDAFCAAGGA